jgi:membrane-associated phospholipid phosphatase
MSVTRSSSPLVRRASLESVRSWRIQLLACVVVGALVRITAYEVGPVQRADLGLYEDVRLASGSVLHRLAEAIVAPFDPLPYLLVVIVIVLTALQVAGRAAALAAGVVLIGATATTQVLKPLLAEPRPRGSALFLPDNAWPSGHTTAAAALALALVLVTPPGRRRPVAIVAALGVVLVGAALVGLGSHYPSDVVGGLCVAGAWGAVAFGAVARAGRTSRAAG